MGAASADESQRSIRSVYGRGLFDGLRMAGIKNVEEFMNLNRLRRIEEGLTGQARKVYEQVPAESTVTVKDVMDRMFEKGSRPERRVVEACLHDLDERGLIKQQNPGSYRRIPVIAECSGPVVQAPNVIALPQQSGSQKRTPLEELAEVERRLLSLTESISIVSRELSGVRELAAAAAINIDDHIQTIRKEYSKLDALKSLLKDL